ncbi:COX15/CtaA family protein [Plantactinospora sp. CA-290183]|uniref:COX15/CtaA family protein n=1 Tax=Plantactinospora sp. CA-290183 TaxID=3240006 RepID=UPI003D939071
MSRFGEFSGKATISRLALASVVGNVLIVGTGGAVRLTKSGLGCPTWPRCTEESYTTTPEMGLHGVIEFGNRLLTFALAAIVIAGVVAAWRQRPRRRSLRLLSVVAAFGIPAQAMIGGLTVLTNLNPWVVGLHFLASMAVIAAAYAFWRRTLEPDGPARPTVPGPLRTLAWLTAGATALVLVVGTWVTGSGPHSGDSGAARNGLDPETVSQVHADVVFLLLGLSVALWFALRAVSAPAAARRAAGLLLLAELGQGLIGFVQYFTGLPVVLVGAHMLGSCLVWLAALAVLWGTRTRTAGPAVDAGSPRPPAAAPPGPERTPASADSPLVSTTPGS